MPDTAPSSAPSSRNQILEDAWLRFAKYNQNASIAQKRFTQQRRWILILGVAATTLGVTYSVVEKNSDFRHWLSPENSQQEKMLGILHFPVLAVPIILGVLVAISVKFNMGISWVMLRSSAEALKKEIYRYRMQVGEYNPTKLTPAESRDIRLARALKLVSKRLMQTPVNQTDLLAYDTEKNPLPPKDGTPKGDDGFGDMTAEQYLAWRVDDQFDYYQKKAARLGKGLRRFQLVIFFLSAVGTLLAGLGFDVWIAVSSALAAAVTAYLEFRRVETNVVSCNISAADLYDIRVWWHALSLEARAQRVNIETLVASTEAVLQTENAGWLQEMREALAEIYGDKKDKDHDASKLLDEVSPALQPSPIAGLSEQSKSTVNPSQTTVEPTPEAEPVVPQAPVDPLPPQDTLLPTDAVADPVKAAEPEIAVDVSDPTAAEAIR
ncbi:DUF4231 domain-containing protein [Stenomitos frigidus]|uniref:SMODS and SLOG-associating 2TM effector domain-containing protein n=1 Tax=Stenomitos frigidus ULC18 TaxID=2107698 RepID=A0A2T1DYD6_9CYAN|nr:DUF4231 domain-containing protein [Stenomitos frigidus]PSB25500.1 hypothetical protein C7B82_23025 [Stenomitos frigidus ULC18]